MSNLIQGLLTPSASRKTLALAAVCLAAMFATSAKAEGTFTGLDANRDNKLTKEESQLNDLDFTSADKDKNGSLSKAEYDSHLEEKIDAADEAKLTEVRKHFVEFGGSLRSHKLKFDVYPESLQGLVDKGLLDTIPKDPWGGEYTYVLKPKATPVNIGPAPAPRTDSSTPEVKTEVSPKDLEFEITTLGPDKQPGTTDDVVKTPTGIRLTMSSRMRTRVIEAAGTSHKLAKSALAYEQAFRVWLAIAEFEYSSGNPVTDLDTITLPKAMFPTGEPEDTFGRDMVLRNVRGLRALVAEEIAEEAPALTMTEADFAHLLETRINPQNRYNWNINSIFQYARAFLFAKGRLPLTTNELRDHSNNKWSFRSNSGKSVHYITFNEDRSFVVFDLGMDDAPGGRGVDADQAFYGPEDVQAASVDYNGTWETQAETTARYAGIREAIKKALARQAGGEAESSPVGEKADIEFPDGLPPEEVLKLLEQKMKEMAEKKAAEAKAKPAEAKPAEAKPAEAKPAEPAAPVAPAAPAVPPPAPAEKPAESQSAHATSGSTLMAATRSVLAVLIAQTPPAPVAPPAPAAEEPKAADVPPVEAKPAEPFSLKTAADMIPNRVYSEAEAVEKQIITQNDYELNRLTQGIRQFFQACTRYPQRLAGTDHTPPIGNITLPSNAHFWENGGKNFTENMWWDEEVPRPHWVVARFEIDANRTITALVVMAVPDPKSGQPIVIMTSGERNQPGPNLFASPKDQPANWYKLVTNCDGDPAKAAAATTTTPVPPPQPENPTNGAKPADATPPKPADGDVEPKKEADAPAAK